MDSRDTPGLWINSSCINIWKVMQDAAAGFGDAPGLSPQHFYHENDHVLKAVASVWETSREW